MEALFFLICLLVLPRLVRRRRRQRFATSVLNAAAAAMRTVLDVQPRSSYASVRDLAISQLVIYSQVIGAHALTTLQAANMLSKAKRRWMNIDALNIPGHHARGKHDLAIDIFHRAVKVSLEDDHVSAREVNALGVVAAALGLKLIPETTTLAIVGVITRQAILDPGFDLVEAEEMLDIAVKLSMPQLSDENKRTVLGYAFEMAIADGMITSTEKTALEVVVMCLGYPRAHLELLFNAYMFARMHDDGGDDNHQETDTVDRSEAWRLLGVDSACTEAELRAAYRNKMRHWHPDIMPPERREEATRMSAKINEAYAWAKEQLQPR